MQPSTSLPDDCINADKLTKPSRKLLGRKLATDPSAASRLEPVVGRHLRGRDPAVHTEGSKETGHAAQARLSQQFEIARFCHSITTCLDTLKKGHHLRRRHPSRFCLVLPRRQEYCAVVAHCIHKDQRGTCFEALHDTLQ